MLGKEDVQPLQLGKQIEQMLHQMKTFNHKPLDPAGAASAANLLNRWVNDTIK